MLRRQKRCYGDPILFHCSADVELFMIKKLFPIGNGLGLVIDRSLLELLDITTDTPLEIKTDGDGLIIRPMKQVTRLDQVLNAAEELMDAHDETFRRLAQ